MKDLEIILDNKKGALAALGETLGKNKISIEGGGVFANGRHAIAHFLVREAEAAKRVLEASGIAPVKINNVAIQKLRQDLPGQLGLFCTRLADAGVNILAQYSDHSNQLIIVTDQYEKARQVAEAWMKEWW